MKWAYQLEVGKKCIELKPGTEHYFDEQLEMITYKQAVASRNKLIVTVSDPAISRKSSVAIRSLGKFPLSYQDENHRKFFFHLKDGEQFFVHGKQVNLIFYKITITNSK